MKRVLVLLAAVLTGLQANAGLGDTLSKSVKFFSRNQAAERQAAQRLELGRDFELLQQRANTIKLTDPHFVAPWEQAKPRLDWQARDAITQANKPLTVTQIATKLNVTLKEAEQMIANDQTRQRKVFCVIHTAGKPDTFWITRDKSGNVAKLPATVATGSTWLAFTSWFSSSKN